MLICKFVRKKTARFYPSNEFLQNKNDDDNNNNIANANYVPSSLYFSFLSKQLLTQTKQSFAETWPRNEHVKQVNYSQLLASRLRLVMSNARVVCSHFGVSSFEKSLIDSLSFFSRCNLAKIETRAHLIENWTAHFKLDSFLVYIFVLSIKVLTIFFFSIWFRLSKERTCFEEEGGKLLKSVHFLNSHTPSFPTNLKDTIVIYACAYLAHFWMTKWQAKTNSSLLVHKFKINSSLESTTEL